MNIKEFFENKEKIDSVLSQCDSEYDNVFVVLWETSHDCPVHDGFYDCESLSYSFNKDELLTTISNGLNKTHVRDLAMLTVSNGSVIIDIKNIQVKYEPSGHEYVSIWVEGLGVYHDSGNGNKQWNDA